MSDSGINESLLDVYIYETVQNIEQLEDIVIASERENNFDEDAINEIFRVMHTIKGSSSMMMFNNIASLTHVLEDLFYVLRDDKSVELDCLALSDLIFDGVDFIKLELEKIKNSDELDGDPSGLVDEVKKFLASISSDESNEEIESPDDRGEALDKPSEAGGLDSASDSPRYEVTVYFMDGCEMENIRAFAIVCNMGEITQEDFTYEPEDIIDNSDTAEIIKHDGFKITFKSDKNPREIHDFFAGTMFVRNIELMELSGPTSDGELGLEDQDKKPELTIEEEEAAKEKAARAQTLLNRQDSRSLHQSIISVDVEKLDMLMDLMGEMVIAEAMVTQSPELEGLKLDNFLKSARQLRKITGEMQDMVMAIRMVPLSAVFHKMQRIVRDMSRRLDKEINMELIGENTEVDKNIIENLSDPLMHLVRNAIDHGLETEEERIALGKPKVGTVTLEALNAGNDVVVMVKDDGKGLDREKLLEKARKNDLLTKPEEEYTDKEVYNLILLPGFSTNENVTEYSGRGVGMDVVTKNLETVGGTVFLDSALGEGTTVTMRIPLTLAIIDGMNIRVGRAIYTLPTTSIRETFLAVEKDLIKDPDDNEMVMVRGEVYPIIRIHKQFEVDSDTEDLTEGIMLMIEEDNKAVCLFADELLGQHQVVVKSLPIYMQNIRRVEGLAGCTLLGDGSISLILNIGGLIEMQYAT